MGRSYYDGFTSMSTGFASLRTRRQMGYAGFSALLERDTFRSPLKQPQAPAGALGGYRANIRWCRSQVLKVPRTSLERISVDPVRRFEPSPGRQYVYPVKGAVNSVSCCLEDRFLARPGTKECLLMSIRGKGVQRGPFLRRQDTAGDRRPFCHGSDMLYIDADIAPRSKGNYRKVARVRQVESEIARCRVYQFGFPLRSEPERQSARLSLEITAEDEAEGCVRDGEAVPIPSKTESPSAQLFGRVKLGSEAGSRDRSIERHPPHVHLARRDSTRFGKNATVSCHAADSLTTRMLRP